MQKEQEYLLPCVTTLSSNNLKTKTVKTLALKGLNTTNLHER